MASQFKDNISYTQNDYSARVNNNYNAAKQQLQMVRTANLEGTNRALPSEYTNELDSIYTQFVQEKPKKTAEMNAQVALAKKNHIIFLIVKIALIVIGIILAFGANLGDGVHMFGWLLLLAAIICHFSFKAIDTKKSEALKNDWISFFNGYAAQIGHAETLHSSATGVFQKIDQLYLVSLDDQSRGFEIQSRQMKKQMEAQNEQHQQAMAMQRAQAELLSSQLSQINQNIIFNNK